MMRLLFLPFGKCSTVSKGLAGPPGVLLAVFKVGGTEVEASRGDVVCSRAHGKAVQESFTPRAH